ncbi:hypothetical protein FAVG1_08454 [Fusarium avenaceum]|nr:hypothetical protein FAVG1_08454 [Fusarium avenaceum]
MTAEEIQQSAARAPESIEQDDIPVPHDFEVEPFGLFILHPSPDIYLPSTGIDFDIVAVHGLNGSARKTWTDSATGQCWLEDLLPESIPRCRIMTFGYDSKLAFSKSRSGVEAFAQDLLNRLRVIRSSKSTAHLYCSQSRRYRSEKAHNGSEAYASILKATTGIVFLGTPHRGSDLAPWGLLLSNLVSVTSIGKNIRKELLRTLSKDSDTLREISSQFLQRATSLKIMSFIEQQVESPLTTLVVPEYSAIMGLPNETVLPLNAHHRGLTRFSRKTDQNYILVEAAIREVAYGSMDEDENKLYETLKTAAKDATEILPSTTSLPIPMTAPILFRSPINAPSFTSGHKVSASSSRTMVGSAATSTSTSTSTPEFYDRSLGRDYRSQTPSKASLESQSLNLPEKMVETITLRVSGLRRRLGPDNNKQRDICHVIKVPRTTEMWELGPWLQKEVTDTKEIKAFRFKDQEGDIRTWWEDVFTTPVDVTSGRPSYSKARAYKINTDQSIAAFMSKAFPHPIHAKLNSNSHEGNFTFDKVSDSVLEVGQDGAPDLVISFMRTVRVPESDKEYDLPPGLGRFPLFNIAPFSHSLPPSMVAKGGFFFPMYQMEAMWIHFHTEEQKKFAIRLYVGGVNGLSGESSEGGMASILRRMNFENQRQDYLVLPEQLWLDGIATAPGVVSQFVATEMAPQKERSQESRNSRASKQRDASSSPSPHGDAISGASIEWQVTGRDEVGGLQLQIIPAFEPGLIHAGSARNVCVTSEGIISNVTPPPKMERVFDVLSTPAELNLKAGDTIHVKDLKSAAQPRPRVVLDLLDEGPLKLTDQDIVELEAVHDSYSKWAFDIKLLGSQHPPISLSFDDDDPFDLILDIVANELQASKGSLAVDCSTANITRGWIPITSWRALKWLPRLTGKDQAQIGQCEFTFIPDEVSGQSYICRVVCDEAVESTHSNIFPLLLALDGNATVENLRDVIHQTTGVLTADYLIQRDSLTSPPVNDGERVFPKDRLTTSWTGDVPQYLLARDTVSFDKLRQIRQPPKPFSKSRFNPFHPPGPPIGPIEISLKTLTGKVVKLECELFNTIYELKTKFQDKEGIPTDQQRMIYGGKQLEEDRTLADYSIHMDSIINVVLRLRGGGMCIIIQYEGKEWSEGVSDCRCIADLKVNLMSKTGIPVKDQVLKCNGEVVQNDEKPHTYSERLLILTTHEPTVAMSLAIGAGGKIHQHIEPDINDPRIWDIGSSRIVNVQLLDARTFRLVTGYAPPETPVTADLYAQMGLNFFRQWKDEHLAVNNVSGDWSNLVGAAQVAMRNAKKGSGSISAATVEHEEKWGLLETGAWGLLKSGGGVRQSAVDKDFEYPLVMLDVDDTIPKFTSVAEEEEN